MLHRRRNAGIYSDHTYIYHISDQHSFIQQSESMTYSMLHTYLGVASLNGLLYVVGGDDGSSNLHSVEYYNPSSDTWSLISTTMEIGRR